MPTTGDSTRRPGGGRKRPFVLDADEWHHLPEDVYIPLSDRAEVELREMTDARMAVLVYSTPETLFAACGSGSSAMKLPARDLPRLRRQLRFHAILLDVSPPAESPPAAVDIAIDNASGEPLVYVPSRSFRPADHCARLELQRVADGKLALLAYSSRAALLHACGPNQHFVTFPVGQLASVQRESDADCVLIDVSLPMRLRH